MFVLFLQVLHEHLCIFRRKYYCKYKWRSQMTCIRPHKLGRMCTIQSESYPQSGSVFSTFFRSALVSACVMCFYVCISFCCIVLFMGTTFDQCELDVQLHGNLAWDAKTWVTCVQNLISSCSRDGFCHAQVQAWVFSMRVYQFCFKLMQSSPTVRAGVNWNTRS